MEPEVKGTKPLEVKQRDCSVEVLRLLACLIVIGTHIKLPYEYSGIIDFNRLVIACLLADGVAIFWIITGFFLFREIPYTERIKKCVRRIIIPLVVTSILVWFFGSWICGESDLYTSVMHSKDDYIRAAYTLIEWSNPVKSLNHIWFLYVYILIIFCYPVLGEFVKWLDAKALREKMFVFAAAVLFIFNDLSDNRLAEFSHHMFGAMVPSSIYLVIGHIIYKYRNNIIERFGTGIRITALICCLVIVACIRSLLLTNVFIGSNHLLFWYTFPSLISTSLLVAACLSLPLNSSRLAELVCGLAGDTFLVYLVHGLAISFCINLGITSFVDKVVLVLFSKMNLITDLIWTAFLIATIFSVSMIIVKFIKLSYLVFEHVISRE